MIRKYILAAMLLITAADAPAQLLEPSCNPNMLMFMETEEYEEYLDGCNPVRRKQRDEERKAQRAAQKQEFRALLRRVAEGDQKAIVELRGDVLIALLDAKDPHMTEMGLSVFRLLLNELARLEGCR